MTTSDKRKSDDAERCKIALRIAREEAGPKICKMAKAFRHVSLNEFSMGDRFELLFLLVMHRSLVDE